MNLTRGEQYKMTIDHGNFGGHGYMNLALVHRGSPPSWSSEKGEQHSIRVQCNFTGEKHQLDLGPVANGTFKLEFSYTGRDGSVQARSLRC